MRRRDFVKGIAGSAAAWPLCAHAQTQAMPVIGYVNAGFAQSFTGQVTAFHQGLGEAGYVEGRNVAIEYRWAEGHNERLPAMVADMVRRNVSMIAATTTPAALAAKAANTTIPVVFETGSDPVQIHLVDSLNQPGGNITGVTSLIVEIAPKRLELLHELLPAVRVMGLLINPTDPELAEPQVNRVQAAAHSFGLDVHVLNVSNDDEIDSAFAKLAELRVGGLVIAANALFTSRMEKLAALTVRYNLPSIYQYHDFAAAGGLVSYGSDPRESYHLAGVYAGRILKGDKPADLPVQRATKIELIINLKAAKALGINVPLPLSGRADEVIE
jgi:putative ABC transport system substrate-binding protein